MGTNSMEGTHPIRSHVGLLTAALVIITTACSYQQTTPAVRGPWATDIEQAHSEWASDGFVQSVLTDSAASEAELRDMRRRMLNCLTDKGVTGASSGPGGTLSILDQPIGSSISAEQQQQFVSACSNDAD